MDSGKVFPLRSHLFYNNSPASESSQHLNALIVDSVNKLAAVYDHPDSPLLTYLGLTKIDSVAHLPTPDSQSLTHLVFIDASGMFLEIDHERIGCLGTVDLLGSALYNGEI